MINGKVCGGKTEPIEGTQAKGT
ncbi:uncharacterized protein METZ01_LOCUS467373 [marine metagenome]|uniref:Uncharacterized protein n=1 Tax=marine metagenome TaxID=408172 RepID=A0A383B452_9ZZZZ